MEWDASFYDSHSSMQYQLGLRNIEMLHPIDGEQVLDVGCGNGRLTTLLARANPSGRITAIDPSESMINHTREVLTAEGCSNCTCLQQDVLTLEREGEFDAIFSNCAINWVPDHQKLFQVLFRALKPGGRIAITELYEAPGTLARFYQKQNASAGLEEVPVIGDPATLNQIDLSSIEKFLLVKIASDPAFRAKFPVSKAIIPGLVILRLPREKRFLERTHFINIQIEPVLFRLRFDSPEDYIEKMGGVSSFKYFNRIFGEEGDQAFGRYFRNEFDAEVARLAPDPAAVEFVMEDNFLFIRAEKGID